MIKHRRIRVVWSNFLRFQGEGNNKLCSKFTNSIGMNKGKNKSDLCHAFKKFNSSFFGGLDFTRT